MTFTHPFRSSHLACVLLFGFLCIGLALAQRPSEFGSAEASSAALIGILYDLKQDQARKPMKMDIPAYGRLVDEFISKGWDESVLNR